MLWISVILVALIAAYFLWSYVRPKRISVRQRAKIVSQWQSALSQQDPHRRLLESDAVISHLLEGLGFTGSMGDKLKAGAKVIPGLDDVWSAHKLRNRIAHEPGLRLTDTQVNGAVSAFDRVIRKYT